jgi:hypothetical protein
MTEIPEHRLQFLAVEEEDGSWSVIDPTTDAAVILHDEPMVLLQERFARTLARFLNLGDPIGFTKSRH